MSTQKPQPKPQTDPERRQDLALDVETVKDLEPTAMVADAARGGANYTRMPTVAF